MVAERAVEELAAALDISYGSGCGLVAQALELRYRLPRLWALVQDGSLQAWKARKTAEQTISLGREAAAFVDRQAAIVGAKNRIVPNLTGLIEKALIRFEPDKARARAEAAKNHRDVTFDYHDDDTLGSATLYATMDSVDAHDLDATVSDVANQLGRLGDQSPLGHRRAAALGLLAHPQRALDLFGQPDDGQQSKDLAITGATLYVHLTGDDLHRHTEHGEDGVPPRPTSRSSAPPPSTSSRTWLQRFSGITLKPVLDMTKSIEHRCGRPARPTRRGCATSSSSATATASSPAATSMPAAATSTTSTPTSRWTKADHPARPPQPTWRASADDTTDSRPSPPGDTNAPDPAPTTGPTHTASPTRAAPHPRAELHRWLNQETRRGVHSCLPGARL